MLVILRLKNQPSVHVLLRYEIFTCNHLKYYQVPNAKNKNLSSLGGKQEKAAVREKFLLVTLPQRSFFFFFNSMLTLVSFEQIF